MNDSPSSPTLPAWPARLGHAGLLPFAALAAWVVLAGADHSRLAAQALLGYGATITSFLGAIHWGLAMRSPTDAEAARAFVWGVVPSLLAWCALLVGTATGLLVLAALLWACYAVDRMWYPARGLQHWLAMRLRLTLVASLCCLVAAAALLRAA